MTDSGWSSAAVGSGAALPFYTMKEELPARSLMLGSCDLLRAYDLGAVYKFCGHRKIREEISSFLPHIYGNFSFNSAHDSSSLKALVEKPPITGKEINYLSNSAMQGFKLSSGPVDERYRYLFEKRRGDDDLKGAFPMERREGSSNSYRQSLDPLNPPKDIDDEPDRKRHKGDREKKKRKGQEKEGKGGGTAKE